MHAIKKSWLLALVVLILANWSNDQTTVEVNGLKKNRINFYGVLHTRNGEIYSVDNIAIGRLYKQIPVYELPKNSEPTLENDPKKGIITKLDLSEIQEIRVPQSKTWHYQRADGARKSDYIEIAVTQKGQTSRYLIDTHRKIICDQVSPSGPIEKEVPFASLDRIMIQGHKQREENKQSTDKENPLEKKKKCCEKTLVTQARPDAPYESDCPDDNDCSEQKTHLKIAQRTNCPCGPSCNCPPPCQCPQESHKCT